MSAKIANLGLLKIFLKQGYDVIIFVHDVTNEVLSCDSNYIVDVVMWPKFGNSSVPMRKVIITSVLKVFEQINHIFEGCSWFNFNNMGLALDMALKFYHVEFSSEVWNKNLNKTALRNS